MSKCGRCSKIEPIKCLYIYGGLLLALAASCGPSSPTVPYYQHNYSDQFPGQYHYDVHPDAKTVEGIIVDTSGLDVDLNDLDVQTDAVEACLKATYGVPAKLPQDLIDQAHCDSGTIPLPIVRSWLTVKVAGNSVLSCDGTMEVLPVPAPDALCEAKGQTPSAMCPCRWRAGIEQNRYIVVTPNLYLYKDPMIRMVTGCNNPWVGSLAGCARP